LRGWIAFHGEFGCGWILGCLWKCVWELSWGDSLAIGALQDSESVMGA